METKRERVRDRRFKIIELEETAQRWSELRQRGVTVMQIAKDHGASKSNIWYVTEWWAQHDAPDGIRDYRDWRRAYRTDYVNYEGPEARAERIPAKCAHPTVNGQGKVLDRKRDGRCKLTTKQRADIIALRTEGLTYREIGERLGINRDTVGDVCRASGFCTNK